MTTSTHHPVRTFFASIFGFIALNLIVVSVFVVWLNRTLTDTTTYVNTVAPLVTKPDIQNFIAGKVTDTLLQSAPPVEFAAVLLPPTDVTTKTPQQQATAVRTIVNDSVLQVVRAPRFQQLWVSNNLTAHEQLVAQIESGAPTLSLDLSPLVRGIATEVGTTKLAAVTGKLEIPEDAGKLHLQGKAISKFQGYYDLFRTATWVLVAGTTISTVLAVLLSVEHIRTLRRILIGTGISSLTMAASLVLPAFIKIKGLDRVQQKAAAEFASVLFHNLQLASLILGLSCIVLALASKAYSVQRAKERVATGETSV